MTPVVRGAGRINCTTLGRRYLPRMDIVLVPCTAQDFIDGQQRMTTLQVLFAAARAVAHGIAADSVVGRFTSLPENRAETVHEAFPDDRYKLWPLPQDRAAFL
jgi:hypothetical protein